MHQFQEMTSKYEHPLDAKLLGIPRLASIPAMLPFIGGNYESPLHKKLLLIGESYYFPYESTIHRDPAVWYQTKLSDLNESEVSYLNCRALLSSLGHPMYQEISRCIAELPLEGDSDPISQIAYMNAFFRPAPEHGESILHHAEEVDYQFSHSISEEVINILSPDLVVYLSKYAWNSSGFHVAKNVTGPVFEKTAHPTSPRHWNVATYPDGREKFMRILREQFLEPNTP